MPEVTLSETYVCRGKILVPGTHTVSDDQYKSLQEVGAVKAEETDKSKAEDGKVTRLASGAVISPTPSGVTPGDPVQRASVVPRPVVPSAVEQNTADPAAGLPPPVVHTSEGEAVEPDPDGSEGEDPEDDGSGEGDDPEGDDADPDAINPPAEATKPPARPSRVPSRPRTPAAPSTAE